LFKEQFFFNKMAGTIDYSFLSGTGFTAGGVAGVNSLILQPDGKIIVGGQLDNYNGLSVNGGIVRLNSDGIIESSFNNGSIIGFGASFQVNALALQPDGKIIVGGNFAQYDGVNVNGRLVRLNSDGTIDSAFNNGSIIGFNGNVFGLALQPDGKIIVGGNFAQYDGVNVNGRLVRLNSDGTIDSAFNNGSTIGFNLPARSITLQPDGKILVGGDFTQYDGVNVNGRLVRLNSDGTIDSAFNNGSTIGFNSTVYGLALQPDGRILVGGDFAQYDGVNVNGRLVRLNSDGTLDSTFTSGGSAGFNLPVYSLALQPDGKVLVGGEFTQYDGVNVNGRLVRLNSDGTTDLSFGGGNGFGNLGAFVATIVIQPDGKVLVGGGFTTYNNVPSSKAITRLNGSVIFSVASTDFKIQKLSLYNSLVVRVISKLPITSAPGYAPGSICVTPVGNILIRNQSGNVTTF
jgi:uncharacterized delta-60 repeat protein